MGALDINQQSMPANGTTDNQASEPPKAIVDFMLAEYTAQRTFRQDNITSGNSRFNYFLLTISGALIGIGLVYQWVRGAIADLLAVFIFVGLLLHGLIMYARMVERHLMIVFHTRGMDSIRRYFCDLDPNIKPYLIQEARNDEPGFWDNSRPVRSGNFVGMSGTVALINCLLIGVASALLAAEISQLTELWSLQAIVSSVVGMITAVLGFLLHNLHYHKRIGKGRKQKP